MNFRTLTVEKLYPLAISRGVQTSSDNLFVTVTDGVHMGIGELSPATGSDWTAERGQRQLEDFVQTSGLLTPKKLSPFKIYSAMRCENIDPPAMAALDVALWDLLAKQAEMPLYRLLGLTRDAVATSVTIGLNPAEITKERVPKILGLTGAKFLKIKLGSPHGLEFDIEHFMAAKEAAEPFHVQLRVDANGGWSTSGAVEMIRWLADQGVDYVEQPLAEGCESELPQIMAESPLPIFLDESVRFSESVPRIADRCHGVNLKLMKCGGITEALRIVATARAHGLKTMIGCMSETSIAISAGAALSSLFDHIDLDSHLNLNPDPATGAEMSNGVIHPSDVPGHGGSLVD